MSSSDAPVQERSPQALLEDVLDFAPIALVTLGLDGVVTYVGGSAVEIPREHFVGRHLNDLAQGDDQIAAIGHALAGREVDLLTTWGGRFWNARFRPTYDTRKVRSGAVCVFVDVTDQVLANRAAENREAFLSAVIEATHEALLVLDRRNRILIANARSERLFAREVPSGTDWYALFRELSAEPLPEPCVNGRSTRREVRLQPGEVPVWVLASASPLRDRDGDYLGCVAVLTDITSHKQTQSLLQAVAMRDPLTGVGNRSALTERLQGALERQLADRRAGTLGVLFCDVDGLKAVNDRHGHAIGDGMLQAVAARIAGEVRPEDMVARIGGDEFVVLCESIHEPDEVAHLAERIRLAVREAMLVQQTTLTVSVSIGAALAPPHRTPEALLAAADAAAYDAKRLGGDRVQLEVEVPRGR